MGASLDIEDLVLRLPGIAEAAVIGVPDDEWGERPVAFVVRKPGAEAKPREAAIRQHVHEFAERGAISKYAVPDRVTSSTASRRPASASSTRR